MLESKEFTAYSQGQVIDEGLRNFMLKIYNYMAGGLCATALAAYIISSNTSLPLSNTSRTLSAGVP